MKNIPEIDFVITWVDGSDEEWRKEKALYKPKAGGDDRPERYRDWDILQYWFRGVEKYAPWVRKIHFVTWGHLPKWLDTSNPKLNVVNHKDYIPEEYRPTFNSNVIELSMHKIKDLSENFVCFNDDMFPIKELNPTDFFEDGKACDMLAFQPVVANPKNPVMSHIYLNNTLILSKYFSKRENVKKQPGNYYKLGYPLLYFFYNILELGFPLFSGFYTVHGPHVVCKRTYDELWEKEFDALDNASRQRFRGNEDLSICMLREWQKLKGDFKAKNILKNLGYFNVETKNPKLVNCIKKQKKKIVCINDANDKIDFEKARDEIKLAFESIFPEKSSFEL